MNVPPFNSEGLLPPGDYKLTLSDLRESLLVKCSVSLSWDQTWRQHLVDNLAVLVNQLWQVGVTEIFINGSFVEAKWHPNDIDGYFECDLMKLVDGALEMELNGLDPYKVWTWDRDSRRLDPYSGKKQLPMWHQYKVELYPHYGQGSGIKDGFGNELQFPSAFRLSRESFMQKGIVKIVQEYHHDKN